MRNPSKQYYHLLPVFTWKKLPFCNVAAKGLTGGSQGDSKSTAWKPWEGSEAEIAKTDIGCRGWRGVMSIEDGAPITFKGNP